MTTLPSSVKHNTKINHDRHHRNDTKKSEVCPKSAIKTPERVVLVSLLRTLISLLLLTLLTLLQTFF